MSDLSNEMRAMAMVLDADPDVAAVLSLQLHVLGMESRHYSHTTLLLEELALCRPQLVIMALELDEHDGITLLRRLAELDYQGRVLLLSGGERQVSRIAERVGATLGLKMLGSLDKPMRLAELHQRLGNLRFGCTHVQGFGLSRPVPDASIPDLARYQLPMRERMADSGASPGSTP